MGWHNDAKAWESSRQQAVKVSQCCLEWLFKQTNEPVPMIRLDFMLRHIGPGKARVVFGEYCEMGACCLGWADGPRMVWRAAVDGAQKDFTPLSKYIEPAPIIPPQKRIARFISTTEPIDNEQNC